MRARMQYKKCLSRVCVEAGCARRSARLTAYSPCTRRHAAIRLPAFRRGCHVITHLITRQLQDLADIDVGLAHFFVLVRE